MARAIRTSEAIGFNPWVPVSDLFQGAARMPLWTAFAADEIQQRYRRSKLGLVWIVISYLIFVGSISLFFGNFSALGHGHFSVYVAVNFAIFTFLLANFTDGCAVFWRARAWISSVPLPHSVHVFKSVSRSLFVFAIQFALALTMFFYYGYRLHSVAWEAIPAFLILCVDAVLVQMILGYITARYRDIEHLVLSLTRVMFFITPVLWVREEHSGPGLRNTVAVLNPFTHALEIFSAPILGRHADILSWQVILCCSGALLLLSMFVGGYAYRRLPYWL